MKVQLGKVKAVRKKTVMVPAGVRVRPLMHAHGALHLLESLASPQIVRDVEQLLARGFEWHEVDVDGFAFELRYRHKSAGLRVWSGQGADGFAVTDTFPDIFDRYFNKDMLVRRWDW